MGDTRIALGKWDRVLSSTDQALSSAVVSKDRIDYEVSRRYGILIASRADHGEILFFQRLQQEA